MLASNSTYDASQAKAVTWSVELCAACSLFNFAPSVMNPFWKMYVFKIDASTTYCSHKSVSSGFVAASSRSQQFNFFQHSDSRTDYFVMASGWVSSI